MIKRVGFILILIVVIVIIRSDRGAEEGGINSVGVNVDAELSPLAGQCYNNIFMAEWWSYVWCYGDHVRQIHFNHHTQRIESENQIGTFVPEESGGMHHIYRSMKADCLSDEKTGRMSHRYAEVTLECCEETGRHIPFPEVASEAGGTVIAEVKEPVPCSYYMTICSEKLCNPAKISVPSSSDSDDEVSSTPSSRASVTEPRSGTGPVTLDVSELNGGPAPRSTLSMDSIFAQKSDGIPSIPDLGEQEDAREKVREMFYHGYDNYMSNAFPEGDLNPLSCKGEPFDLIKIPLVTLIDSLDTLVIMGNHSEFRRAVSTVCQHYPSFDLDVNVSVFETTIRVLGGLLSAHLMAIDDSIGIYNTTAFGPASAAPRPEEGSLQYDGSLLRLASDLGDRLLPAFQTNTGIPYGTVNLRYGVPRGETEIASTAGAGSLLVEFEVLSSLSGERKYGDAAYAATRALFDRRSSIGLLGKHIHTDTGRWFESVSGIGSNSDSFYEYLLKAYLLFRKKEMYGMFSDAYASIKRFVQVGDWFSDVDMFNGKLRRNRVENLHAFWPGMEASLGFSHTGARQLNSFYSVWTSLGYLPEEFDNVEWLKGKNSMHPYYPLRPELIESTYMQYRTTKDRSWLAAGLVFVNSVERTRTSCGFASVNNMDTMELADIMPSFFLSETLKYLYLLFDEDNFVHERAYIFSTEAHPFDPTQLPPVHREEDPVGVFETDLNSTSASFSASSSSFSIEDGDNDSDSDAGDGDGDKEESSRNGSGPEASVASGSDESSSSSSSDMLPQQCSRRLWWDSADSFVFNYIVPIQNGDVGDEQAATVPSKTQNKIQSSWQLKLLSGDAPLPSALNMLMNIINSNPTQAQAGEGVSGASDGIAGAGAEGLAHRSPQDAGRAGDSSWESALALEIAQRQTVSQLRIASKAVRQLELRGQYDDSEAMALDSVASTRYAPFDRSSMDVSTVSPEGARAVDEEEDSSTSLKKKKNKKNRKKSKGKRGKSAHSVGLGRGTTSGSRARGKRRPQTCYPEDSPGNAWTNAPPPPGALQTVEISMGPLGDFTVHVYSDGFIVRSRTDGDALEISNVGHDLMFVRDTTEAESVTVIGDMSGQTISCEVTVSMDEGGDGAEAGAASEAGVEGETGGETSDPRKEIWRRSCSIAAFGGSEAPRDFLQYDEAQTKRRRRAGDGVRTFAPPTVPPRESHFSLSPGDLSEVDTMCQLPSFFLPEKQQQTQAAEQPGEEVASKSAPDAAAAASESPVPPQEGGLFDALSSFIFGAEGSKAEEVSTTPAVHSSSSSSSPSPPPPSPDRDKTAGGILAGSVAIARRGDCMFQAKARVAHQAGAEALVVVNNENNVFIMSGQKADDGEDSGDDVGAAEGADGASAAVEENVTDGGKTLTTVMLSSSDGEDLLRTLALARAEEEGRPPQQPQPLRRTARVGVEITSRDMALDSALLGARQYPKLRLKKNLIHVIGRGRWGCILTSQNGGEWQLFIQRKEDLNAVDIWPTVVANGNGELVTVTPILTNNPVEFYSGRISRSCPRGLREREVPYVSVVDGEDAPHLVTMTLGPPVGSAVSSDGVNLDRQG